MIVGIDLGTTNSLIGVFENGTPRLLPNAHGHLLTPSAVAVAKDGSLVVGLGAREMLSTEPRRVATQFKRWMGTDQAVTLGGRKFRSEELSACVLRSLKADAERELGGTVEEAVITVPAYFNDAQRSATRVAGELAGLKVERLLNEPTAAGLAYGLEQRARDVTYLVFDLGGGTFDVSVLEHFDGIVQVRASAGDTRLGGEDFNHVLYMCALRAAPAEAARALEQKKDDPALWRVLEQAKRALSERAETELTLELSGGRLRTQVTRAQFETACEPLLARLRRPIERALRDAGLGPDELSEVVLVGGATRAPMVVQLVARLFQRLPLRHLNPDEVVARGATVQAALKVRDKAVSEVVLTDVMPFSLGIISTESVDGQRIEDVFSPIIERNTPVPVSRVSSYCTVEDRQRYITLDIRQGESPVGTDNLALGKLSIAVPPAPAGEVSIDVRFTYDVNGLLQVDASEETSGNKAHTLIERQKSAMTPEQIKEALARVEALKIHPREVQENVYLIERAKRLYEDRLGDERERVRRALSVFELSLDTQDPGRVAAAREQFKQLLDDIDKSFVL